MPSGTIMRVKWLRRARHDLDAEIEYIAKEDADLAVRIYAFIRDSTTRLANFPDSGRPGRVFGTRELVLTTYPYILPYRVKDDTVQILRVFHTSQKQPLTWD